MDSDPPTPPASVSSTVKASIAIPVAPVAAFDPNGDPGSVSLRWKRWTRGFEVYAAAAGCTNQVQLRQLLLHSAGPEVQDIFDTLSDTGNNYENAKAKLTDYFTPHQNIPFNRHVFRQDTQKQGETIAQFVTRLRQLAAVCDFGSTVNDFIRDQVIDKCLSKSLRTKLLAEKDLTLDKLLEIAQAKEASEARAAQFQDDRVYAVKERQKKYSKQPLKTASKQNKKDIVCFKCGQKGHYANECRCSKNVTCFECHKVGHFASMCPSKVNKPGSSVKRNQNKQSNAAWFNNESQSTESYVPDDEISTDSDSDSKADKSWYVFSTDQSGKRFKTASLKVNGVTIDMVVDSGSSCNIVNSATRENLRKRGVEFVESNRYIHPYGSDHVKASCEAIVEITHQNKRVRTRIICIEGTDPSLLSRRTATNLGILRIDDVNCIQSKEIGLEEKYPGLTKGIGKLKGHIVKLHIDQSVPPVATKRDRVPFHMRERVENELKNLLDADIIEEVHEPTEWISPIVLVEKPKSPKEVRICVDMREPNKAILRTRYTTLTIDELIHDLKGANFFSKIDLRSGYHQLYLHPDSRYITTFSTHCGLYRYKRLIFGVNAAAELFQHTIQSVIAEISGAKNISDDIIIFGTDRESHDKALQQTLQKLHECGLTINEKKCEFSKKQIKFFGHVFSDKGILPDPEKVEALKHSKTPSNPSEVRSFLGMAQYCARFMPELRIRI